MMWKLFYLRCFWQLRHTFYLSFSRFCDLMRLVAGVSKANIFTCGSWEYRRRTSLLECQTYWLSTIYRKFSSCTNFKPQLVNNLLESWLIIHRSGYIAEVELSYGRRWISIDDVMGSKIEVLLGHVSRIRLRPTSSVHSKFASSSKCCSVGETNDFRVLFYSPPSPLQALPQTSRIELKWNWISSFRFHVLYFACRLKLSRLDA